MLFQRQATNVGFPDPKNLKQLTASDSGKAGTRDQKAAFNQSGYSMKLPSAAALKSSLGSHPPVWHFVQTSSHSTNDPNLSSITQLHVSAKERLDFLGVTWKSGLFALKGVNLSLTIEEGHVK